MDGRNRVLMNMDPPRPCRLVRLTRNLRRFTCRSRMDDDRWVGRGVAKERGESREEVRGRLHHEMCVIVEGRDWELLVDVGALKVLSLYVAVVADVKGLRKLKKWNRREWQNKGIRKGKAMTR